jgi:hypothetical protein
MENPFDRNTKVSASKSSTVLTDAWDGSDLDEERELEDLKQPPVDPELLDTQANLTLLLDDIDHVCPWRG